MPGEDHDVHRPRTTSLPSASHPTSVWTTVTTFWLSVSPTPRRLYDVTVLHICSLARGHDDTLSLIQSTGVALQ